MVQLGELMMILELHRHGLSVTAIARRTGRDPKTVRKYIERGIEAPLYGPRSVGRPSKLGPFMEFLRERVVAFPDLSAVRLTREIRELGYGGAYTAVKRFLAAIRPENGPKPYEVRFETPPGVQAQVDFARFVVDFTDDPGTSWVVWLFSLVLGHSRFLFARYVLHQDLQTLLRCHIQAFDAIDGVPIEILYDRMKTAVTGEDDQGYIAYNRSLLALAQHYRFQPRACRPYRAKTKGKVERPFSYIRQDFFLGRSFRDLEDLNAQLIDWLGTVANVRVHGTTQRVVAEAFAAEQPELQTTSEETSVPVDSTGEIRAAQVFVAVMGASSYTYAEASWTQTLPDWIGSHVRALAFMGGVPAQLVPDNPKVGVTRANWYEPGLNRTYLDLATHYGTAILPARPRKPRDKI